MTCERDWTRRCRPTISIDAEDAPLLIVLSGEDE